MHARMLRNAWQSDACSSYVYCIAYCLRQYNEYCIANTVLPIALGNTIKT